MAVRYSKELDWSQSSGQHDKIPKRRQAIIDRQRKTSTDRAFLEEKKKIMNIASREPESQYKIASEIAAELSVRGKCQAHPRNIGDASIAEAQHVKLSPSKTASKAAQRKKLPSHTDNPASQRLSTTPEKSTRRQQDLKRAAAGEYLPKCAGDSDGQESKEVSRSMCDASGSDTARNEGSTGEDEGGSRGGGGGTIQCSVGRNGERSGVETQIGGIQWLGWMSKVLRCRQGHVVWSPMVFSGLNSPVSVASVQLARLSTCEAHIQPYVRGAYWGW
ncbi:hypothetical protein C8F01DRAFT_1232981 [Mycena amicta]|nr:hypothetical protein C8F01DRAFT_1232981 [Mycena amicta]